MHVVIGGFGRVGRYLAHMLEDAGHSIAVIDRSESVFAEHGQEIRGLRIAGEVFDRRTLVKAGIERADAYAAVTSGDNSNIVSARVARERFGVEHVVARIFDPRRAAIYERFGIASISSVQWAGGQLLSRLLESELTPHAVYGAGEVMTVEVVAPLNFSGRRVSDIELPGKFSVGAMVREGEALLPHSRTEILKGDRLYVTVTLGALPELKALLGMKEGGVL